MSEKRLETFAEFWPFYVKEHSKPSTRRFHFAGTTAAVALALTAVLTRKGWPLGLAFVAGYGPAWYSHFFIENNRPATFKYPFKSLAADFVMWSKMLRGTMDAEVERVCAAAEKSQAEASHASPAETASALN